MPASLARLDAHDMLGAIRAFPDHLHEGWARAATLEVPHRAAELAQVLVVGMGGSAIGGDLVRAFVRPSAPVPVGVVRDYRLPASVGRGSLVVASSYSGGTEETLAAMEEALERGAAVYAVTSGGALARRAEAAGLPLVRIPGGMQPRAALGYSFGAVLRIAQKLGLCDVPAAEFEEARRVLAARAEPLAEGGEALELARRLHGRLAVIYTGPGLMEAVGVRWQNQIHENAKQLAYGNRFAELNHNEIMAWEAAPEELRARAAVVVLRDEGDHPQVQRRMDVTRGLLEGRVGSWSEVEPAGKGPLARMLSAVQLGDFVSFHLAMLAGVDPTPVDTIQALKATLAKDK